MNKEFKIDLDIYSESILNEAILDFEEVAKIELKNGLLIIDWNSNNDIEESFNELMNYVISLEC